MSDHHQDNDQRIHTEPVRPATGLLKSPDGHIAPLTKTPACVRFMLPDGQQLDAAARYYIMLGREDNDNHHQIDVDFSQIGGRENGVSRCHAIVRVTSRAVFIKDFNSRNGTFLNGYELHPMRDYILNDGDEIVLGRIKAQVKFIY